MAAGLRNHTQASINQDYGKIGSRTSGNHIACILFMSRSIGYDKFTVVRGKITVSYINRNTLLTLCFQPVAQQSVIYMVTCIPHTFAVTFQGGKLVLVQLLAVKQQTSYQGRLSIVYRTGCQQA